jgi:hypothetical protein
LGKPRLEKLLFAVAAPETLPPTLDLEVAEWGGGFASLMIFCLFSLLGMSVNTALNTVVSKQSLVVLVKFHHASAAWKSSLSFFLPPQCLIVFFPLALLSLVKSLLEGT